MAAGLGSRASSIPLLSPALDLFVSLQLRYPLVRSILVTGVACAGASQFSIALREAIRASGKEARTVEFLASSRDGADAGSVVYLNDRGKLADVSFARDLLREHSKDGYLVLSGEDFLTDSLALVWSGVSDGVVLLAGSGRTTERALVNARGRLAQSGGTLLGSVYIQKSI